MIEKYEEKIEEVLQSHSGQMPAAVWAVMAIARAIIELADAVRYRTAMVPFVQPVYPVNPPYEIICTGQTDEECSPSPICPYCSMSLDTAGNCTNTHCYQAGIGKVFGTDSD